MNHSLTCPLIALTLLTNAQAAVILFLNQDIPIPQNFTGVFIDIETGATTTADGGSATSDVNFFFGGEGVSNDAYSAGSTPTLQFLGIDDNSTSDNLEAIVNLPSDGTQVVGPTPTTGTFTSGYGGSGYTDDHLGTDPGQFEDGVAGILGFSIEISGQIHYGYFDVTLTNNGLGTVNHWAYEDTPNTPITVVPIPEPTTGVFALISFLLLTTRRRMAQK